MKSPTIALAFSLSLSLLLACSGRDAEPGEPASHEHHAHGASSEVEGHEAHEAHETHADHSAHQQVPAQPPTLNTSLFQLTSRFTDASGNPFPLSRLSGEPSLIVMFYASCTTICPILTENARAVVQALSPEDRAHLRVVFVTFDPERDTPERMIAHARSHGLDPDHTVLLRGASDGDIRELSAVLGVQYRRLPDGSFAHSAVMTLLDRDGRIVDRVEGLDQPHTSLVERIHAILTAAN